MGKPKEGNMELAYHRHDISDEVWNKLEMHLPGRSLFSFSPFPRLNWIFFSP